MSHWPMIPLGDLARIEGGSTPRRDNPEYWHGGTIHWLTPTDLPAPGDGIASVSSTRDCISETGLASCSANLMPAGTVFYSTRATIGKIGIAETSMATNQGFANLVPGPSITSRYLAYALWRATPDITALAGNTTFREVSRSCIRRFGIPVPPLAEQQRIVRILDEADELRRLRAKAEERARDLIPAIFHEMFGDPRKNSNEWTSCAVGDLVTLVNGRAFSERDWSDNGLPIIRIQNLKDQAASYNFYSGEYDAKYLISPGDILLSWAGQLVSFGVFIWLGPTGLLNQHIFKVIPKTECSPQYVWYALTHVVESAKHEFHGIEMKHMTKGALERQRVVVPPISLQREFAARVEQVRAMQEKQAESRKKLDELLESLLHRAFTGEL